MFLQQLNRLMNPETLPTLYSEDPIAISHMTGNRILSQKASALAESLHLPLVQPEKQNEFNTLLVYTENGLQIQLKHDRKRRSAAMLRVDFLSEALNYRRLHGGGIKQALARAVGIKPGVRPSILDATAGLGTDGFILASLGCKVTLVERSPVLAALLQDGLERAESSRMVDKNIISSISLVHGDAILLMNSNSNYDRPDTVYLDPMYPHNKKSALNKQEMRIIRKFAGDDTDSAELLQAALGYALKRVVVKRPKRAEPLTDYSPSHEIIMKNSRYDVYMIQPDFNRKNKQ